MTLMTLLASSVLSGTLPDGRPYSLYLDANTIKDVRIHDGTVRFVTLGGGLGRVDRDALAITDLVLPSSPIRGFVQGAPSLWVFNDAHQVLAHR